MFKVAKVHSVVDLICNSSTTTYSWFDSSVGACKEMVEGFFKTFNIDKKFDDVFYVGAFCDSYQYSEYIDRRTEDGDDVDSIVPKEISSEEVNVLIEKILTGEISKPQWMKDAEKAEYYDRQPDTIFYIKAKSDEYEKLAKLIDKFVNSPNWEGGYE